MKKYLSILSLTALLAVNNAYTAQSAGKPLTAQEKIRVNTLLVREKHLSIDITRLVGQNKTIPAATTKDLKNVQDAIKKYELRDPAAVTQIRKGFTTAAKAPAKPSIKPAGPSSRPAAPVKPAPKPYKPALLEPVTTEEKEEFEGAFKPALEPVIEKEPETVAKPASPVAPKPLPQPEAPKLLKNKQVDEAALALIKLQIKVIPTPNDRQEKVNEVLRQLQDELANVGIPSGDQEQIYDKVKRELYPLILGEEQPAKKPEKPGVLYNNGQLDMAKINSAIHSVENSPDQSKLEMRTRLFGMLDADLAATNLSSKEKSILLKKLRDHFNNAVFPKKPLPAQPKPLPAPVIEPAPAPVNPNPVQQPKPAAATWMYFSNGTLNTQAIYRRAKATKAADPEAAMALVKSTLSGADLDNWNANEEEIKASLEYKWADE